MPERFTSSVRATRIGTTPDSIVTTRLTSTAWRVNQSKKMKRLSHFPSHRCGHKINMPFLTDFEIWFPTVFYQPSWSGLDTFFPLFVVILHYAIQPPKKPAFSFSTSFLGWFLKPIHFAWIERWFLPLFSRLMTPTTTCSLWLATPLFPCQMWRKPMSSGLGPRRNRKPPTRPSFRPVRSKHRSAENSKSSAILPIGPGTVQVWPLIHNYSSFFSAKKSLICQ